MKWDTLLRGIRLSDGARFIASINESLTIFRRIIIVWLVFLARLAWAEDQPEPLPWKVNTPIVAVKKEMYWKRPRPLAAPGAHNFYVGPNLERLEVRGVEIADDVGSENTMRFSSDNGRTWVDFKGVEDTSPEIKGIGGGPWLFDTNAGVLVCIGMRQFCTGSLWNNFIYSKYSRDFGKTWTKPKQLKYEPGDDFDPKDHLKPSFLQRNQGYRGSNILLCHDGSLVHSVGMANAPDDADNDRRTYRLGGLCFIGKWDAQAQDYQWKAGKRISISPDVSSRGLMEPEVAELMDTRLLVVWRGSDTPKTPGRKWYSVSKDGGMTLSEPAEWKYDDGSRFFSPSSWHRMIRHSVTRRLYWVGNISAKAPDGNWPRFPLIIAEVDERKAALKRSTVTAIDDRQPSQGANVQFSNFSLLENRETHELEMLLTPVGEEASDWRNADCYKYTLTMK
jgi:hypothetical protein